ncbi:MAG: ATP-dependent 6-phosphofructokinase [Bacillota bacterium]|nr:ATP-dependent 6-phosphofructokinase [Bacillota bacterium]
MIKKIGIMTGGGDCPGLNAVIHAVVRSAVNSYGWQVLGFRDGYRGLVLNDYVELNSDSVIGLLDRGGTVLGTSNKDNAFDFRVELPDGGVEYRDLSAQVISNLRADGVDALIIIGGDGTMTAAELFHKLGVTVIGVPKTIDNDLCGTDVTFGFNTAVDTATGALDKLHSTAESHHRLMVLEVMGRYAGWIALASGLAGGADIILIPELPYDIGKVQAAIARRRAAGRHFSIIVVAEGAAPLGGEMVTKRIIAGSPDPVRLGGVGAVVAQQLEQLTGMEARTTVLGHLQRGGRPIPYDRLLATRFGAAAAQALKDGISGCMVALRGSDIVTVPLAEIAGKQRLIGKDEELVEIGRRLGVCFGD